VTRNFVATEQSRILEDPESAGSLGGLGIYYGERKLSYVTAMPETSWDGQMLTCVADQDGFLEESVFAMVNVRCTSPHRSSFRRSITIIIELFYDVKGSFFCKSFYSVFFILLLYNLLCSF